MKKSNLIFTLLTLSFFSIQCKKNETDFGKYDKFKINPELLTPLATAKIKAGDLLKSDSIIKYDPDGKVRLEFAQSDVLTLSFDSLVDNIQLDKATRKFKIPEISALRVNQNTDIPLQTVVNTFDPYVKDSFNAKNGTTDTFRSVDGKLTTIEGIPANSNFEYLKISKGMLYFTVTNRIPTEIDTMKLVIYDMLPTPHILGTANYLNIAPNTSKIDSFSIAGIQISNTFGYTMPIISIMKSPDKVLINLSDVIRINVSSGDILCYAGKSKLPAQTIISNDYFEIIDPTSGSDVRLTNIEMGNALAQFGTTTDLDVQLKSVSIYFPDITVGGIKLDTLKVLATSGNINGQLDLTNANINLAYDPNQPYNKLRVEVGIAVDATTNLVVFDTSMLITATFDPSAAEFAYVDGYLGRKTYDVDIENLDVSQLSELGKGIRMEDPKMKIMVKNSFGIPMLLELDITAKDANGNSAPMNVQDMTFPFPSIAERGTVKTQDFNIDKSNSNIVNCLGMPAKFFDVKGKATLNPDGFQGNYTNHITKNSLINLGFAADIPMTFTAKDFTFQDTLEGASQLTGLDDVEFVELKIKTINGFPLGGTLDLAFTDAKYVLIDDLVDVSLLIPGEIDANGRVIKSSENMTTILIDRLLLNKLDRKDAKYIILKTKFNTNNNGTTPVSIYTDNSLEVSLAIRAKIKQ